MTGTAKTEETEFVQIYGMPVVIMPTNEPVIREDNPDVVSKTQEAKYRGIVSEILNMYVREQPVLVGTRSVEVSEYLGTRLAPDKLRRHCEVLLCQARLRDDTDLPRDQQNEYTELLRTPLDEIGRHDLALVARNLGIDPDPSADDNAEGLLRLLEIDDKENDDRNGQRHGERLALALTEGVPHNILNAKYHEQEGRIIAEAGRAGQVTIATNMAGRGVDIVLGGKPEARDQDVIPQLYEKVKSVGGLHILGTERHESRRIDNQLRGRSGRQGDPGSSRFYVSLQDELMKLFGPERFGVFLRGWPEEEAIEHKLVSRSLERAQQKVEMRNFQIRKQTLKYDEVMNEQRQRIYGYRRAVLEGENIRGRVLEMIEHTVKRTVEANASPEIHPEDRDMQALYSVLAETVPGIGALVREDEVYESTVEDLTVNLCQAAGDLYEQREALIGPEVMREIERSWLLRIIDNRWMEHLQEMDYRRDSIHLRAHAQRDPLVEYIREADQNFGELEDHIAEDMTKAMLTTEVVAEQRGVQMQDLETGTPMLQPVAAGVSGGVQHGGPETPMTEAAEASLGKATTYVASREPDRNDPCPCGSGKKYKKCCMLKKNDP